MQEFISVLQADGIGIILMLVTLFSLKKNFKSGVLADKLFFMLAISIMVVCFSEILATMFNGQTFFGAIFINRFSNALLFAINPIPAFLWALFAHCKIYKNEAKLKKVIGFLLIPLCIVVCLSFANLFTDIFFTIDANNLYARAHWFFVSTLLSVFYIVYVIVITVKHKKEMSRELYFPLLSFMILPIVGLVLQFLFYGLYMLWVNVAISVIIIFNHVQNDNSITDWLTGLYNRKHLDNYLQQMCRRKRDMQLAGIMIDIDSFKSINDTYGHLTGDKALQDTAKILKEAVGNKAFVARYAGDEFVVILKVKEEKKVLETINRIQSRTDKYNTHSGNPFNIYLSIGYAIFLDSQMESEDEFLARIDENMYQVKKGKRCSE